MASKNSSGSMSPLPSLSKYLNAFRNANGPPDVRWSILSRTDCQQPPQRSLPVYICASMSSSASLPLTSFLCLYSSTSRSAGTFIPLPLTLTLCLSPTISQSHGMTSTRQSTRPQVMSDHSICCLLPCATAYRDQELYSVSSYPLRSLIVDVSTFSLHPRTSGWMELRGSWTDVGHFFPSRDQRLV